MGQGPNITDKAIKPAKSIGGKVYDIEFGNDFFNMTPGAQSTKGKKQAISTSSKLKAFVHQRKLSTG